jgi:hypothetical protein
VLVLAAVAGGAQAMLVTPAFASCAASALVRSARSFTGTVIGVTNASRTATVRTDDGRIVTVRGGYGDDPNSATDVDRTYQLGARYEFDPVNDADPYQDDICTATHTIGGPFVDPTGAGQKTQPADVAGGTTPFGGLGTWSWLGAAGGGVAVATGVGVWWLRRRARSAI